MTHRAFSVLVVDDNDNNIDLIQRNLLREGFLVTTASNGKQALQLLANNKFDLVLLDIEMPEMDGIQTLEKIKSNENIAETPIIMLTAQNDIAHVKKSLDLGAQDYLLKPFNMPSLKNRLINILDHKQ